jgi:hypothetical protein
MNKMVRSQQLGKVWNLENYDEYECIFFSFKFSSIQDVESILRDGHWMIREMPIFLNKWSPSVSLFKEDLCCVPVWVKFHDVPFVAYTSN